MFEHFLGRAALLLLNFTFTCLATGRSHPEIIGILFVRYSTFCKIAVINLRPVLAVFRHQIISFWPVNG
jgi:hypothetical protein